MVHRSNYRKAAISELAVDMESFEQHAQNYISAEELADDVFYKTSTATSYDEDFIWMAAIELWKRLLPDSPSVEMIGEQIDEAIDEAAILEENSQYSQAAQREAQLVPYLQQHLLDEAGRLNEVLYQKLQPCSMYKLDELLYFMVWRLLMADLGEEARQMAQLAAQLFQDDRAADARALALTLSGHVSEGTQLYEQILERNPKDALYWMHAGDVWAFGPAKDLSKAEGYYKKAEALAERWTRGHGQCQRERGEESLWLLYQRFVQLYQALGREEAKRYKAKLEALEYEEEDEPEPVLQPRPKVGRNEPCPCGSGKKYKYCCGS